MRRLPPVDTVRRLYQQFENSAAPPSRTQRVLHDADIQPTHMSGLRWWATGGVVLALVGWLVVGPAWAVGTCLVLASLPALVLARWSGRRQRRILEALPEWLDMVGRSLRSGSSFRQALVEAHGTVDGPLADELGPLVSSVRAGDPISSALARLVDVLPGAEVRLVAASLALASENEAGIGSALAGVTQSLRDRMALRDEVVGLATQATASMHALAFLPAGFLVFDGLAGGSALVFLVGDPRGQLCLASGCALNVVGWVWMRLAIRQRFSP